MSRTVYLLRHGDIGLEEKLCVGSTDIGLSDRGVIRAKILRDFFEDFLIEAVYSTGLKRSDETAHIISAGRRRLRLCQKLSEIKMGVWDGLDFKTIKQLYPKEYENRGKDIYNYAVSGGESFKACFERAWPAFCEILEKTHGDIIIVGHAGVNRLILSYILQRPVEEMFSIRQDYGCINVIKDEGGMLSVLKTNMLLLGEE